MECQGKSIKESPANCNFSGLSGRARCFPSSAGKRGEVAIGAHYAMNILVNLEIYRIILNNLILMYINISSEVKKIMLKNQTCDLLSIHKQVWLPAV